jgi:hypothetical protein
MVVPGFLSNAYVYLFEGQPNTYFFESINPWAQSPYARSPALIVGNLLLGNPDGSANVSFIGHGYLSWGYLGIYVEAAMFAFLCWLANLVGQGRHPLVTCAAFLMPGAVIAEAAVPTVALSHGFMAAIVLVALMPADWKLRTKEAPTSAPEPRQDPRLAKYDPTFDMGTSTK